MGKEGKVNIKFIVSVLFFSLLMAFMVFAAVGVQPESPLTDAINNGTQGRNINFTFNVTWDGDGQDGQFVNNCTLYTNFTGLWEEAAFNGSDSNNSQVFNGSVEFSSINFTFSHDIGNVVWDVACYNGTGTGAIQIFNGTNRSLAVDNTAASVVQTADIFNLFNTSTTTPTITINITDVNGTGLNLTATGGNNSVIINISDVPNTQLNSYAYNTTNLTCTPNGEGITTTQCTLDIGGTPLSNGTKNLSVFVIDRTGHQQNSSFLFTVDQIPPIVTYFNITNSSQFNPGVPGENASDGFTDSISTKQGNTIFVTANFSDNLSTLSFALFQVLDGATWVTLNTTKVNISEAGTGANTSFPIPYGHNRYSGENLTFRILVNDSVGNQNATNFTSHILVNDTTVPTASINGTIIVNGTNTTDTRPLISWFVNEKNPLTSINVSVNFATALGKGLDPTCNKFAFYDTSSASATVNVEKNRNGSFQIVNDPACTLGNGTHNITVTVIDSWSNTEVTFHTFSVESGNVPGLVFNSMNSTGSGAAWPTAVENNTNITSNVGLTFSGTDGTGASIDKIKYVSSCNSSNIMISENGTTVYPFNESTCPTTAGARTLTVTINDTAGNDNTTIFTFNVDNVAPTLTVNSPTEGQNFTNIQPIFNLSAVDESGGKQGISSFGYYLDGQIRVADLTVFNMTNSIGFNSSQADAGGIKINQTNSTNLSVGTHTIKFTVNDTLGNVVNSSTISFRITGPVNFDDVGQNIENYSALVYGENNLNVSVLFRTAAGNYETITTSNSSEHVFELRFEANLTANVSLTDINGSNVNWGSINFTPLINDSIAPRDIQNNWTNTVFQSVVFNNSIEEFISDNNSYFGTAAFPFIINLTNASRSTIQEFWWIVDEDTKTTRTNISQCTAAFSATTTTPCWNYSGISRTVVFVPHFSEIHAVNDSDAPTVNVTTPKVDLANSNQSVSSFVPNITVSSDAVTCIYHLNATAAPSDNNTVTTMIKSGTQCLGSTENLNNGEYNITFNVTDASGNVNSYLLPFNVTDTTAPNNGLVTSGTGETSADITVTGTNESVNVTVNYGTTNTSLTSSGTKIGYAATQTVALSSLSAGTKYYYNVSVCDIAGNCKTNTTVFSFTTGTAAAATTTTTTTTTTGSSGGSGGATTTSNVVDSKAQIWSAIPTGSSVSLNIDKTTIAVTSVSVSDVTADLKNVELEVEALTVNPLTTDAAQKVYQYLRINRKNIGDTDASSFKVGFRVPKSWLTDNALASGDISLYRYKSGWNELATKVSGTDSTYVNYEADTPGFSSFAVGTKTSVDVPDVTLEGEDVPSDEEEVAPPDEVTEPIPVGAPGKSPMAWVIAAVVVILGIVLIAAYQQKKKQV
jgi:PGF-pre-PGF domain-containing protein